MKWIAHRDILEIRYPNIVRRTDMNVKIIYVYEKMIFVTELMIVMMGQMKMNKFAETSHVIRCQSSNVATLNAFPTSLFVTVKMIVEMVQMRTT